MFGKKAVLAVGKSNLVIALVRSSGKGKIVKYKAQKYEFVNIRDILTDAKTQFRLKNIRILFSDDVSYLLKLKIDKSLSDEEKRRVIKERIQTEIPEYLGESDWDFVQYNESSDKSKSDEKTSEVIVFAPVRNIYLRISEILKSLDIKVDAVEPEFLALTRSSNPIIGLAKKKDIEGDDSRVMNLIRNVSEKKKVSKKEPDDDQNESDTGEEDQAKSKTPLLLVLFLLMLGAALYYFLIVKKEEVVQKTNNSDEIQVEKESASSENNSIITEPEAESSPTPEPNVTPATVSLEEYDVMIINSTTTSGLAREVSETLSAEGFDAGRVQTGNTNKYDSKTKVLMKKEVPASVYETIERALNSDFDIHLDENILDENLPYDIEIILGEKIS